MLTSIASNLGFGSGIDTSKLVKDLAAASRAPKAERLDSLTQSVRSKISALAKARSNLDSFAESLRSVASQDRLRSTPVSSNSEVVVANASAGGGFPSSVSSEIEVLRLARGQTNQSSLVSAADAAIGQGDLIITLGSNSSTISIGPENDSLSGLVSAINAAGLPLEAKTLSENGQVRLILKGEAGAANAFTINRGAGADPSLSLFTTQMMTLGQNAQNASIRVDGISFDRPSNIFSDVVAGLSLTLKAERPGTMVGLSVQRPTEAIKETASDFVSVFNELKAQVSEARTASNGASAIRLLDKQLSALIGQRLSEHPTLSRLSDIGIKTNRDGSISLDQAKLAAALQNEPDAVEALFAPSTAGAGSAPANKGVAGALEAIRGTVAGANGPMDILKKRFQSEADALVKDRERMEAREAAYRLRLEAQFGAMDGRIGSLKATQSYLDQQIRVWTNARA